MYLGTVTLGEVLTIWVQTTNPNGTPTAPDASPALRVYGDEEAAITTASSIGSAQDSQTGWYRHQITCSEGNGYEAGKTYTVRVTYAISSTTYSQTMTFDVV